MKEDVGAVIIEGAEASRIRFSCWILPFNDSKEAFVILCVR